MNYNQLCSMLGSGKGTMTCAEKSRLTFGEAWQATVEHNQRWLCVENFGPYWCPRHSCWHVGHASKNNRLKRQGCADMEWCQRNLTTPSRN